MEIKFYLRKVCFLVDIGLFLSLVLENIFELFFEYFIIEELDISLMIGNGDLFLV